MGTSNNVIDNGNLKVLRNNDNDNDRGKYDRSKRVDWLADDLMAKLKADKGSRPFLCKVAWKLPESVIWQNYESSLKGKNQMGLFIYLCKRDM